MYDCRATATSNKAGRCGRRDEGNHDIDDCVVRCALCVVRCTSWLYMMHFLLPRFFFLLRRSPRPS